MKRDDDYQHTRLLMIDRQLARKKKNEKRKGSRSRGPARHWTALCCLQRMGDTVKPHPLRDAPPSRLSILCVVYAPFFRDTAGLLEMALKNLELCFITSNVNSFLFLGT
jgi:hypothetical protein